MPVTYKLIASNTLSTTTASVTFSAIPGTFTDLALRVSARSTEASTYVSNIYIRLNGTSTGYGLTNVYGFNNTATSSRASSQTRVYDYTPASTATLNTFGNLEWYIPNYTGSTTKPISAFSASENNSATLAYVAATAGLATSVTSAVTSILIALDAGSFESGSSFFLYGIKNS